MVPVHRNLWPVARGPKWREYREGSLPLARFGCIVRKAIAAVFVTLFVAFPAVAGGSFVKTPEVVPAPPRAPLAFHYPVCDPLGTAFGTIEDPFKKEPAFHTGLDFPAPYGTPVKAAAAGRLTAAERRGPYGLFLEIDHGHGFKTRYGQLQTVGVGADQAVEQGETIARVGSSGRSTGPHLHFEIMHDGFAYDPRLYLVNEHCQAELPGRPDAGHRVPLSNPPLRPTVAPADEATHFSWPVCGPTLRVFGHGTDPFTGRLAFHSGIDLNAPEGSAVRASAGGRVIAAELRGPYGNVVEIDHGPGHRTRYAHLSTYNVKPGDAVGRGDVIGQVGSTGRAKGPHLHFEIWINDVVRDPSKYLQAEPPCSAQ